MASELTPEDRALINDRISCVLHAWDHDDADTWAASWTDDGIFEVAGLKFEGLEAIKGFLAGAPPEYKVLTHTVTSPFTSASATEAGVAEHTCYTVIYVNPTAAIAGIQERNTTLKKIRDGVWKIQKQVVTQRAPAPEA